MGGWVWGRVHPQGEQRAPSLKAYCPTSHMHDMWVGRGGVVHSIYTTYCTVACGILYTAPSLSLTRICPRAVYMSAIGRKLSQKFPPSGAVVCAACPFCRASLMCHFGICNRGAPYCAPLRAAPLLRPKGVQGGGPVPEGTRFMSGHRK